MTYTSHPFKTDVFINIYTNPNGSFAILYWYGGRRGSNNNEIILLQVDMINKFI